jgi:hypothetical protein
MANYNAPVSLICLYIPMNIISVFFDRFSVHLSPRMTDAWCVFEFDPDILSVLLSADKGY